jgi:hypothetical protein
MDSVYRVKRTMTLIVFNLEALLVRRRRLGDSILGTQGNAEAVAAEAVRRGAQVPDRRPANRGIEVLR